MPTIMYNTAVVIGRFQPLHNGHIDLINEAASMASSVKIVLGGQGSPRSRENPWHTTTRAKALPGDSEYVLRDVYSCGVLYGGYSFSECRKRLLEGL